MTITEALWRHLNAWPDKPAVIGLDALAPDGLSLAVSQITAAVALRRFIDGSYIGRLPFALQVRVPAIETQARIQAVGLIYSLRDWLAAAGLPELGPGRKAIRLTLETLPCKVAAYENGTETWQAVFALEYKEARI